MLFVLCSPIDFIDETGRRWAFVACFIALTHAVFSTQILKLVDLQGLIHDRTAYRVVSGESIAMLWFDWQELWLLDMNANINVTSNVIVSYN